MNRNKIKLQRILCMYMEVYIFYLNRYNNRNKFQYNKI